MSCQTPRMSAWSPPESLSGTPTSSSGSLPRTPSDDAPPPTGVAPPPSRTSSTKPGMQERPSEPPQGLLSFGLPSSSSSSAPRQVARAPRSVVALAERRVPSASPNKTSTAPPLGLAAAFSHDGHSASSTSSVKQLDGSLPSVLRPATPSGVAKTPDAAAASRVDASLGPASHAHATAATLASMPQPLLLSAAKPAAARPGTPESKAVGSSSRLLTDGASAGPLAPPPAGAPRKRRKRSTPEQIEVLERHFAANDRPTSAVRESIASELNMTARQVQIWMQNRRQTRKKRLLEAAGEVFRPSSPTSLGGHPSSDSVGSIPSSEMDDLPFATVYGARRVVSNGGGAPTASGNKENRPVLLAGARSLPSLPASAAMSGIIPAPSMLSRTDGPLSVLKPPAASRSTTTGSTVVASRQADPNRSPSLPRASRVVAAGRSARLATAEANSNVPALLAGPPALGWQAPPSSASLLDKCVQSRELPFVHQKRPRPSVAAAAAAAGRPTMLGPSTSANLPVMGWRDDAEDAGGWVRPRSPQPLQLSPSGRDVWRHMMSDPPSGGLLELHEDDDGDSSSDRAGPLTDIDDDDDDEAAVLPPAKVRRTSDSSSSAGSASRRHPPPAQSHSHTQSSHLSVKKLDGHLRHLRRSSSTSSSSSSAPATSTLTAGTALPAHLDRRPSLRRSASLDCAASRRRPSPAAAAALALKRAARGQAATTTTAVAAAYDEGGSSSSSSSIVLGRTGRRRSLAREETTTTMGVSSTAAAAGSASPFPPAGLARPATKPTVAAAASSGSSSRPHDMTDVECARLLMGLLGGI